MLPEATGEPLWRTWNREARRRLVSRECQGYTQFVCNRSADACREEAVQMGARRRIAKPQPEERSRPSWLTVTEQAGLAGAVAAVLSLAYLLYVIVSGGLSAPLITPAALEGIRHNVAVAEQVFSWGLWIAVIAAGLRYRRSDLPGYVAIGAGAFCALVLPLVVRARVPQGSARDLVDVATDLVTSFQTAGGIMIVLGFLRVVIGYMLRVASMPRGGAVRRVAGFDAALAQLSAEPIGGRPSLMRRCWELHYCRGSLRVNCPRYKDQVACWKARSGCYCDHSLATRLLDTVSAKAKLQVAEEMQAVQSRARTPEKPGAKRGLRVTAKKRKPPCGDCPIYLDHQKYKYRVLAVLAYPAAAAIIGLAFLPIKSGYEWVDHYFGARLAVTLPITDTPIPEAQWLSAENVVIILIGVVVAATILHLTEMVVFRLKL